MRRYERWWFRLWINAKAHHRPPRAAIIEWPYIWTAHLLAWVIGVGATRGRKGDEREEV